MSDRPRLDPRSLGLAVGGQAVFGGVSLRTPKAIVTAVRTHDGRIVVRPATRRAWTRRVDRVPVLRGIVDLIDEAVAVVPALLWSARRTAGERRTHEEAVDRAEAMVTLLVATVVGIGLFFWLPMLLPVATGAPASTPVDGLLRTLFLGVYLLLIGRLPDVQRMFAYRGALHQALQVHEAGMPLRPRNARAFAPTRAIRSTSILGTIVVLAAVLCTALGWPDSAAEHLTRLAGLAAFAGGTHELARLTNRYPGTWWTKIVTTPASLILDLTVREPSDAQVEVAMAAIDAAVQVEANDFAVAVLTELTRAEAIDENWPRPAH